MVLNTILIFFKKKMFRFQKACIKYGVPDVDLFQTTDLYDMKNIALVTQTIFAVGRAVSIYSIGSLAPYM